MPLLTASELASMRSVTASALPDTCVIQTQAWASDGGGGGSQTWTTSGTLACRIAPAGGHGAGEGETGDRISADSEYVVTLPSDTSLTTNARLLTGGGTFNVEAIRERSWNLSVRAEVVKQV